LSLTLAGGEPRVLLPSANDDQKKTSSSLAACIKSVLAVVGALCNDGMADSETEMLLRCAT